MRGAAVHPLNISCIVCQPCQPCFSMCPFWQVVHYFDAQIVILELLEHKPILTGGYKAILHLHSVVEECEITKLLAAIDPKTKEKKKVGMGAGEVCDSRAAGTECKGRL